MTWDWDAQRVRNRDMLDEFLALGLPTRLATLLVRADLSARDVRAMTDAELLRVRQLGQTALTVIREHLSPVGAVAWGQRNTDALLPVDWERLAALAETVALGDLRLSELLGLVAAGQLAWPDGMAARKRDALACVARREVA